jgi:hypothetical protein
VSELSDEQVLAANDDLEMMRRPHLWPMDALPLMRGPVLGREYGVLFHADGLWVWAEGTLLYGPRTGTGVAIDDSGLVELVADGWVVD